MKLGFGVIFWDARFGVQTPSEARYPSTFYEGFTDPVWASFSGVLLWERCFELRIRYFMGLLWLVCIGLRLSALVCKSPRRSAFCDGRFQPRIGYPIYALICLGCSSLE